MLLLWPMSLRKLLFLLLCVCAADDAVNANVLGGVVAVKTLFRLLSVLYFSCWNYCGCEC